ncbi:GNAT family N-acetyltransferase [Virgibacillus sp. 179-BFC.A HS]|uniref:GNAT family N-acetyltransferase n=1 Tax=Tigheibacillus jepli TaxID=3035914 RepID=A0ABU5CMS7_9BACI|nr:GNAT family N-acetyltransferase [Virgibacillus sp. 179-BFC.A HS]MDY0406748.1 GNAT family N-acetyltransferase [Virgibacillus sp. 179-BFC.A HS]
MKCIIRNMNADFARSILSWKYDRPYDFYNNSMDEEGVREFLSGSYRAIIDDKSRLFGFLCTGESAQVPAGNKYGVYRAPFVDIGLGMNPNFVGRGYGHDFMTFIIGYITQNYTDTPLRLSVATFNKRAIHLYEKMGFVMVDEFASDSAEFITMVKKDLPK